MEVMDLGSPALEEDDVEELMTIEPQAPVLVDSMLRDFASRLDPRYDLVSTHHIDAENQMVSLDIPRVAFADPTFPVAPHSTTLAMPQPQQPHPDSWNDQDPDQNVVESMFASTTAENDRLLPFWDQLASTAKNKEIKCTGCRFRIRHCRGRNGRGGAAARP